MVQKLARIGSWHAAACIREEDGLAVWMQHVPSHSVTAPGSTPRQFQLIDVGIAGRSIPVDSITGVVSGLISAPEWREQEGIIPAPSHCLRVQDTGICCSAQIAEFWEYGQSFYKKLNQNWKKSHLNVPRDYLHGRFYFIWFTWISDHLLRTQSTYDSI